MSNDGVCVEAPSDPIPGVYKYCDDWCGRCPVTARCLSYRLREERRAKFGPDRDLTMSDMVSFTREVARAAGETTEGLDAMLTGDPRREFQPRQADAWLADVAFRYGTGAARFLRKAGWDRPMPDGPSDTPPPIEMLAGTTCWWPPAPAAR